MATNFAELYSGMLKEVFITLARGQVEQGADALTCADAYAESGKPDFALAYLLLLDADDEVKRSILAHAYEQRAQLTEEKAEEFDLQFHRPFPLMKLEAQKDRQAARAVRQGKRIRGDKKMLSSLPVGE